MQAMFVTKQLLKISQKITCLIQISLVCLKRKKKIAILMDEIDGMNGGDKGGINSLIKLIRPKKTKKQKKKILQ